MTFDKRNCYMSDEEMVIRERAVMAFEQVEDDFSYPALIWWAIVSILAIGSFFAGLLVGSRP
jgi:hypothetical protein